jgi:uncharacterized glyoxalase superfamily protein PhnB
VYYGAVAGAIVLVPPAGQFYCGRTGALQNPFGNQWLPAKHIKDATAGRVYRRLEISL